MKHWIVLITLLLRIFTAHLSFGLGDILTNKLPILTGKLPTLPVEWSAFSPAAIHSGDAMVWTRTATTGETKSISFSKSSPAGMIVNCGDGRGERTLPNSPFQCKYATGGSYQASIANPELITSNFSISYGNITAFWAGKATNISGLSIGYNEITTLPVGAFSKLPNLTRLVLNRNKITSLPAGVFDGLSGLNTLDLSNNQLTSLPAGIFSGLSNLSTLHFYYNQLTSLPAGIFDGLSNLINLYWYNNQLTTLPAGIFDGLSKLTDLRFDANQLTSLPNGIFDGLSNLSYLYLYENQLTTLPNGAFDELPNLTRLYLNGNQLTSLADKAFSGLSKLVRLYLDGNQLTSLPDKAFSGLSNITHLIVDDNQLTSLPADAFDGLTNIIYLYLHNNCLDTTLNFDNPTANSQWNSQKSDQKVCPRFIYTPSTPTTGNVLGTLTFTGGDAANKATLENSNPPITSERTENGSKGFDLSGLNNVDLLHPNARFITGTVDWIITEPPEPPTPPTPTPPAGGWGGGGSVLQPDFCPNGDFSPSYYDGTCEEETPSDPDYDITPYEHNAANIDILPLSSLYKRTKEFWLTSSSTLEDFKPDFPLTRAEMAKVITLYSEKNPWFYPPARGERSEATGGLLTGGLSTQSCATFTDLETTPLDLQPFIIQACQLGLMGLQADGESTNHNFNPNETTTLAEVATILSRFLRWDIYKGSEQRRYHNHLLALQKAGLIPRNVDPMRKEPRENIFTILYTLTSIL